VVEIFREHNLLMGKVDFDGLRKQACLEHVADVRVGEYVIVHVGFAIARVDEDEAREVFKFLERIRGLDELGPDEVER
jgi:hydrogenase expression/formation protein HypC